MSTMAPIPLVDTATSLSSSSPTKISPNVYVPISTFLAPAQNNVSLAITPVFPAKALLSVISVIRPILPRKEPWPLIANFVFALMASLTIKISSVKSAIKAVSLALAPQSTNAKNAKKTGLLTLPTAANAEPISPKNQANASANNQTF
jgi:hypothetical protein